MRYILVFLAFCAQLSLAEGDSKSTLVLKSVLERYKVLGNWKAKFTQHTHSEGLGSGTHNQGLFYFVRPNRFRYSLKGPEFSEFISDGSSAWQVRYPGGENSKPEVKAFHDIKESSLDRYLLIFRGPSEKTIEQIEKNFRVDAKLNSGTLYISFEPRGDSELSKIELFFENSVEAPSKAIITDLIGTSTQIQITSFENIKSIDPKIFRPTFLKNTKVEKL